MGHASPGLSSPTCKTARSPVLSPSTLPAPTAPRFSSGSKCPRDGVPASRAPAGSVTGVGSLPSPSTGVPLGQRPLVTGVGSASTPSEDTYAHLGGQFRATSYPTLQMRKLRTSSQQPKVEAQAKWTQTGTCLPQQQATGQTHHRHHHCPHTAQQVAKSLLRYGQLPGSPEAPTQPGPGAPIPPTHTSKCQLPQVRGTAPAQVK